MELYLSEYVTFFSHIPYGVFFVINYYTYMCMNCRLGKDLTLDSNSGNFRCAVCQADEAPNDGTIFSASSGPMLCLKCSKKKDAMEGKRASVPTLMI